MNEEFDDFYYEENDMDIEEYYAEEDFEQYEDKEYEMIEKEEDVYHNIDNILDSNRENKDNSEDYCKKILKEVENKDFDEFIDDLIYTKSFISSDNELDETISELYKINI